MGLEGTGELVCGEGLRADRLAEVERREKKLLMGVEARGAGSILEGLEGEVAARSWWGKMQQGK